MVEEDEAPPPPPRGQDVDECVEFAPMVPPKSLDLMQSLPPPKPIRRKEESEPAPSWSVAGTGWGCAQRWAMCDGQCVLISGQCA